MNIREIMIPAVVGSYSLVGVSDGPYPMSFGNYFCFSRGPRCVNMWAENLERWVRDTGHDSILVRQYDKEYALVIDSRLPKGWT